jgi:hypothetical protein
VKYLVVVLFFITLWIVFVLVVVYLTRRRNSRERPNVATAPLTLPQALPAAPRGATCCLQVPCSAACAAEHQRQRELLDMDHGRVAAELRKILEFEADPYPADLEQ